MEVINVGHICIDKNKSESVSYESAGSPAIFMGLVFSKLAADYCIVSAHGDDFAAYNGDTCLYPPEANVLSTLVYFNDSTGPQRVQRALNREFSAPVELDSELRQRLANTELFICSPILPNYSVDYLQQMTAALPDSALKILLPQGFFRDFAEDDTVKFREFENAEAITGMFDFTILSEEDYPNIDELAREWTAKTGKKIIITRGERGAQIVSREGIVDVPTTPVENVVDSVGCGDVFSAAFAYHYRMSGSETESVKFAHRVAGNALQYTPVQMRDIDFVNGI